jgi:hypothetical protein
MPGPTGFGTSPQGYGPSGMDIPEPIGDAADQLAEDIHQIRRKYVDGATNLKVVLQLAANAGNKQDMTGQEINSVILTVQTGVIFGYFQDQSSGFGAAAAPPDFAVSAGIVPTTIQIMVPTGNNYKISFQEGAGAAAVGVARIMKI